MKNKFGRYFAIFMILNILIEISTPTVALALTNGTTQPELQGFQPAGSSEMVDLFTGDFKYNIPLMEVDGYPLNIAYQAGQNMEAEASWVGLGWSLNPGVMNRMMRGLPDDFNGDAVASETNVRPNVTVGIGVEARIQGGVGIGFFGVGAGISSNTDLNATLRFNNYTGFGLALDVNQGFGVGVGFLGLAGVNASGGMGFSVSTDEGITTSNYGATGYSLLNEFNSEKANSSFGHAVVNSVQRGSGTVTNSRTGLSYDMYFQSKTATSTQDMITPFGSDISVSKSVLVPTSSLAYPPRINNSFTGVTESNAKLLGVYGCAIIPFTPFSLEAGIQIGFPKYKSSFSLMDPVKTVPAYGYMNLENSNDESLMDFNRYKDGVYMPEAPNGPYASLTNDVFVSSAQGMASNFRAFRSDYGVAHDPVVNGYSQTTSNLKNTGLEVFYLKQKENYYGLNETYDGIWAESPMRKNIKFYQPDKTLFNDGGYEKFFFKQMGEPTPTDVAFENLAGGQNPIKPSLSFDETEKSHLPSLGFGGNKRLNRAVRNTHISSLSASEANDRGLVKGIRDFTMNNFGIDQATRAMNVFTTKSRTGFNNLMNIGHHLSELTVTKDDGSRYIYGIPVYNKSKKEVIFNASDNTIGGPLAQPVAAVVPKSNYFKMVKYTASDASTGNNRGLDNYFRSTQLPAYAQSFLLTGIISADYVDLTNDGPTADDLGNYMIFNYSNTNEYQWRSPFNVTPGHPNGGTINGGNKHANLSEGFKSDEYDDKGIYEYGKRDNWYLHSIESKNYVAEFKISLRDDNCGVLNEEGDIDGSSSYKLDKVTLYAKEEKIRAQALSVTPVPIKTVSFEYDYSLCKNVFNNKNNTSYGSSASSGKLTLRKIYFTYGDSRKMALSPYKFSYGDSDHDAGGVQEANPDYDPRAMDRWGNYKPNNGAVNSIDFPYSEQNQGLANIYSAAWNLTTIETPSGAKTDIYYESDDYCYVQDEPTAMMLNIKGFYPLIDKTPNFDYATNPPPANIYTSGEVLVDLQSLNVGVNASLSKAQADAVIQKNVFPKAKQLFLKCKTLLAYDQMYKNVVNKDYWESVPCYAKTIAAGIVDKGNSGNTYTNASGTFYKYAWVRLNMENEIMLPVNPVSKAGWEMVETYMPKLAHPGLPPNQNILTLGPLATFNAIKTSLKASLADFFLSKLKAQNLRYMSKGYCRNVDYSDCWVRAYTPYKKKMGGGYRVKKIITKDQWATMATTETSTQYGQTFDYTTSENGASISSGVASYEPIQGGDENSMHQPINFSVEKKFAPNDHYFQETPYLEYLYPSAFVGYSKITVKSIDNEYPNGANPPIKIQQVGKTVHEFYTAKEFPLIERKTVFDKQEQDNDPIDKHMEIPSIRYRAEDCAQGFALKMNDMHGKLKSVKVYGEDNLLAPLSGKDYYYKAAVFNNNGAKELSQNAAVIDENMIVSTQTIGRNIDVTCDQRHSKNTNITTGSTMQRKLSICNPLGRAVRSNPETSYFLSHGAASVTKVISQYGILDSVKITSDKSVTVYQNMLRDKNTGEVVLTKTRNNFDQPVYTFNQPAYWAYSQMGHKYARQGLMVKFAYNAAGRFGNNGKFSPNQALSYLHAGDEVFVYKGGFDGPKVGDRFWVVVNPSNASQWLFLDANGAPLTDTHPLLAGSTDHLFIKVDRPIERNTQSYKMASTVSLYNPLTGIPMGGTVPNPSQKIIQASAQEYCNVWDYYKKSTVNQTGVTLPSNYDHTQYYLASNPIVNPYSANQIGCWRPWRSSAYYDSRSYDASVPNNKNDGLFTTYSPFWQFTPGPPNLGGTWTQISNADANYQKWVVQKENYVYSPYGYLMESKNALGIASAVQLGYNHTLPVLQAYNASASEVGFDGFEEYEYLYPSFGVSTSNRIVTNDYLGFYREMYSTVFPNPVKPSITKTQAHSGRFSLKFTAGQNVNLTHDVDCSNYGGHHPVITRCDLLGSFILNRLKLDGIKKYVISFWVKSSQNVADFQSSFNFDVKLRDVNGNLNSIPFGSQKSVLINGWQKFDYEFQLNSAVCSDIVFSVSAPANGSDFYLDDFRVQPYFSSMTCTVYDPYSLKVWAQLDDRNFATFTEYDNAGALVRTKKETVNGVYTLNETRSSLKK